MYYEEQAVFDENLFTAKFPKPGRCESLATELIIELIFMTLVVKRLTNHIVCIHITSRDLCT